MAIGTNRGFVQIWDAEKCRRLRTMTGHTARVGKFYNVLKSNVL